MKTTLIVPTPEVSNAWPTLDRSTLIIELDIDRAIAGGAFAQKSTQQRSDRETDAPPSAAWRVIH
jgi:hypothetical protein